MAKRRKKKRSRAQGKRISTPQPLPTSSDLESLPPRPMPIALRVAFLLGVGATVALLAAGVFNSIRTEGRLPRASTAYMGHIDALFDSGEQEQALEQLQLALALDIVNEPLIMNNLGNALQARGESAEAISYYQEAIRIKPNYAMPYYNLAKALSEQGQRERALELYRAAVELDPEHVDARNNLANALAAQGEVAEAVSHYQQVILLQPDNAAAHNNLAWVLEGTGRLDEARQHFQEAIRIQPELGAPVIGLAWVLATHPREDQRDPERARELAGRALQLLKRPDPRSLDIAAAAFAAAGEYEQAVQLARAALDMAPLDLPELPAMRERLELYRRGRPYTQSGL